MTFLTQTTGKIELLLTEREDSQDSILSCWLNPTGNSLRHTDRGRTSRHPVTTTANREHSHTR